jgi:hypothetical protein
MNIKIRRLTGLVAIVFVAAMGSGCISQTMVPTFAKSGDILNVGLGGIKRNSDGSTLTKTSLTVEIMDAGGNVNNGGAPYAVKVLNVYRVFPDHSSQYAVQSLDRTDPDFGQLHPYDGAWWATVQLVHPSSANNPTDYAPLPLEAGNATVTISSIVPGQLFETGWQHEGDHTFYVRMLEDPLNLPMAAIRDTPGFSADPSLIFEEFQYTALAPEVSLNIAPDDLAGVSVVGGMQIRLDYPDTVAAGGNEIIPRLVPLTHDPNITIIQHTEDNGDGTYSLVAMVTNPNGFVDSQGGSWAVGNSSFEDLQFAVIAKDPIDFNNWASRYSLDPSGSFYIDDAGVIIGSVTPVLSKAF